jgi:hypothetical protein
MKQLNTNKEKTPPSVFVDKNAHYIPSSKDEDN